MGQKKKCTEPAEGASSETRRLAPVSDEHDTVIYFNQDYTTEVQKKRKQERDIIKKLKEKNVKAQSPYTAQIKVSLDSGTKTFATLTEPAPMLKDMGINVEEDRVERLHRAMTQSNWTTATGHRGRQGQPHITEADMHVLLEYK